MQSNVKRHIAAEPVEGIYFYVAKTGQYAATKIVPELIGKHGFYMWCSKPSNTSAVWYAQYLGDEETQSFFSLKYVNLKRGMTFNRETGELALPGNYLFSPELYEFYAW